MKQNQYEAIITCIQYGAPALSQDLINSFVQVVQNSNEYITMKQKEAEVIHNEELKAEKDANNENANKKANLKSKN